MGWEKRNGRLFYYHTYRFKGRRRRVYLGPLGDPVAELAAAYAALSRINVELEERAYAQEVAALRDGPIIAGINAAWEGLCRGLRPLSKADDPPPPGPEVPKSD